ncbi:NRK1 [Candida margitis]|uniref:NRK1 n=1 Tax=Candida margitis TaxID=1775924 RepID=UPI002227C568|nr:NRK1 [Candida margitis]KAI5969696.1 NRK1 [Candida margitis]
MTRDSDRVVLIAFGGPSSSGKTTVAQTLKVLLPDVTLIHLDDFYLTDSQIPVDEATGYQNWDCAEAIDFEKFKTYIRNIKSGKKQVPVDSIQSNDLKLRLSPAEKKQILERINQNSDKFARKELVFIDGFMLFHNPEIIKLFDIELFFHASFDTLKKRRESRGGYNTVEGFWVDPPDYFANIVWPAFVNSHKYLFIDENVANRLKPEIAKQYNIYDINNDNDSTLFDLVQQSLQFIIDNL